MFVSLGELLCFRNQLHRRTINVPQNIYILNAHQFRLHGKQWRHWTEHKTTPPRWKCT